MNKKLSTAIDDADNEAKPQTNDFDCCIKALCSVCRDRAECIIHINDDWGVQWCGDSDCQADIMQQFNIYEDDMPEVTTTMADCDDWGINAIAHNETVMRKTNEAEKLSIKRLWEGDGEKKLG